MHKLILDSLLLINHSNMFQHLSWSQHQGVRNPWQLQSHCIDLLECCYVYVFTSRYDSCGMLRRLSIPQLSYRDANTLHNILTDQYNGFVPLKDFELPDDDFNWGAETCWSDWSVINYPELICEFCRFIFCLQYILNIYKRAIIQNLEIIFNSVTRTVTNI